MLVRSLASSYIIILYVMIHFDLWDAVVWNPGEKPRKNVLNLGDEYKRMLCVDSAVFERPVVLKPSQIWKGFQEIKSVASSYCSGQLDARKVVEG